jgi:cytochrome b561
MFALVVIVGVLGLLHDTWPKKTQAFWINVHALIGILLWLVLIARFGYGMRVFMDIWPMRRASAPMNPHLPPKGFAGTASVIFGTAANGRMPNLG